MRQIKFRAWDKRTKQMCYVIEIRIGSMVYLKPKVGHPFYRDITDVELLQYTGLKDNNGKEIYEGDIIKGSTIFIRSIKLEVKWDDYEMLGDIRNGELNEFEVIGNIYENKDLLEVKKCGGEKDRQYASDY